MLGMKRKRGAGGVAVFRVSDVVEVPLRGLMLRLRRVEGTPSVVDLGPGAILQLKSAEGTERRFRIVEHTVTGGKQTQERLERTGELDVLVVDETGEAVRPEIGWLATGPVSDGERR
jgi:hypothetical protein